MGGFAFIFPGQGSQIVGMGRDIYEAFEEARTLYDEAEEILGFPVKQYSFDGPDDILKQTYVTQPALFVHSVAITNLLASRDIMPVIAAGHSLGEYSALAAAGVAYFSDLLRIVKVRGELMQTAGEKSPGTMAALIGCDDKTAEIICMKAQNAGIVKPANYNAPGQIVISGSVEGVNQAMKIAKENGVRKVVELNVGGAFHSPLMADALGGLIEQIRNTSFQKAKIPVVANVTAKPEQEPEKIKQNLEQQLLNPVRWSDSVRYMAHTGIDAFIEVGAGRVLQGLVKRIDKDVFCYNAGTVEDLKTIVQAKKQGEK